MRKASPFSGLKLTEQVGLDQRLFSEQPTNAASQQRNNQTTEDRNNGTTPPRAGETTQQRANDGTSQRGGEGSPARTNGHSKKRVGQRQGQVGRFAGHGQRQVERHSHDVYHDQVQWINRVKLELEEQYGSRVTSNAIVQLAIDRLRRDFEAEGEPLEITSSLLRGSDSSTSREMQEGGGNVA